MLIKSFGLNRKKFLRAQQSLDWFKNAGKPRKGISPSTVYVSSLMGNQNENLFYKFASL